MGAGSASPSLAKEISYMPNNIEGYLENLYGEFMGFPSGVFYEEGCGLRYRVDSKKRIGKNS